MKEGTAFDLSTLYAPSASLAVGLDLVDFVRHWLEEHGKVVLRRLLGL